MKKYLYIFKSELMSELQYIPNILVGFINFFIMIFIFLNLWTYIYSDPSELINGYSMNQMIWYVIITELLWMSLGGRKLDGRITDDVKSGNVTYNINKPYSYIGYILSTHLGSMTIKIIIFALLAIAEGFLFMHAIPSLNIFMILIFILTCILATVISILLITSLGLLAFFIEDAHPFYWVYSKLILVIGTIFPIEYFPSVLQPIIRYSPIYVVSYGPAKLFVDFSYSMAFQIIISQIIYVLIAYLICKFVYKKGVRKLNVNGG